MTDPETVADLDPDREVYVGPSGNVGIETRAHLYNDAEQCRYTGDLRAVTARCLFADQPVCKVCTDAVERPAPEFEGVPAIEDVSEVRGDD